MSELTNHVIIGTTFIVAMTVLALVIRHLEKKDIAKGLPEDPEKESAPTPVWKQIRQRPRWGRCPGCGAEDNDWCLASCDYVDPADWR